MTALRGPLTALLLALALAGGPATPALAGEAVPASTDPALDAHVMRIASELRCLVCQNQTIADSHADLAVDLRRQVREMLQQGRTDAEIFEYMTVRYGDFVLYRPPLKSATALLWFGPPLLLIGGLAVLLGVVRRRGRMSADRFEADTEEEDLPGAPVPPAR